MERCNTKAMQAQQNTGQTKVSPSRQRRLFEIAERYEQARTGCGFEIRYAQKILPDSKRRGLYSRYELFQLPMEANPALFQRPHCAPRD